MRRKFGSCIASLATGALLVTAAAAQTTEQSNEIRVTVRIEGTQTPVAGAQVALRLAPGCGNCETSPPGIAEDLLGYLEELALQRGAADAVIRIDGNPGSSTNPESTAITNEDGSAVFRGLKPGMYEVVAKAAGYVGVQPRRPDGSTYRVRFEKPESSIEVLVDQDHPTPQAMLSLVRTASVRGRVLDSTGAPVAHASVILGRIREEGGRRAFGGNIGYATTNAAGEYVLTAEADLVGDFVLRAGQMSVGVIKFAFYPEEMDLQSASLFSLQSGTSLSNIDIRLKNEFRSPSQRP